jgi:hypothetical protein
LSQSTRKLIGAIALLIFIGFYCLLVMALATSRLAEMSGFVELLFYAAAGLLWVPPAMLIIRWMEKRPAAPAVSGGSREAGR